MTIEEIQDIIANNKQIKLSDDAKARIVKCRTYLDEKLAKNDQPIYGINTGFGSLHSTKISNENLVQLQENLLLSHACGTGDLVPHEIIKIMLLLKVQSLAYGHSAAQLETVERLIYFFNNNILPVVFELGSLGASGDLAPLAHLSLPLIGEGNVWVLQNSKYEIRNAKLIEEEHNLSPIKLKSKEGLALINGTQFMSAYGVYCLIKANQLLTKTDFIASISIDAFDCRLEPFHHLLHDVRPHKGQINTAKNILANLADSEIAKQPKVQVQDQYAFRCIPQVHGASKDAIEHINKIFTTEINSVTDNPNVFADEDLILSGGNFHGQTLAIHLDFLAIALAELGSISERRTYQLISGQRNLPAFLVSNPGLNSGFMIPQYTAASIVSQNKQLCTPASVDSIVSSNGQEDHVSMGANAATKCLRVVKNLERIVAIELLNASQALEFRRPLKSASKIENYIAAYRQKVPFVTKDRFLHDDIENSVLFLNETDV
ncbi:MAG: histidine ammonia-lyase [Bacteroidia bacterium]|nr:histidine ammonia-lyase [Bacteroidia bacterium]